jgi:transposase
MTETLTMSKKEIKRISVLQELSERKLTHAEAALKLGVCERHTYWLHKRFSTQGEAGLVHGLRGKPSNYHRQPSERQKVLELYGTSYADYGPTLFCEELARRHGIEVDHETVRRWLSRAGLWAAATKKHPHRRKRPRRTAIGDMVQFDGSPHDWFEGRGPECTLLHAIDDASNLTFLRLAKSENTIDAMRTMRQYVERYGAPRQLYVDFGSVYYQDNETPTQFKRAMKALGTEIILQNQCLGPYCVNLLYGRACSSGTEERDP